MNDLVETYRGAVYPWHCDHMGHMNVMWYVGKFDEATWNLFASFGVTASFLRKNHRGMAAVQQNITYRRELLAGDIVSVHSALLEIRDKVARWDTRCATPRPARCPRCACSRRSTWMQRRENPAHSRPTFSNRRASSWAVIPLKGAL